MTDECTCPDVSGMSSHEIINEVIVPGRYCTYHKHYQCSALHKKLAEAKKKEQYFSRRTKKLQEYGVSREEIASMPRRTKRKFDNSSPAKKNLVSLEDIRAML